MTPFQNYRFADLQDKKILLDKINRLEAELGQETGEPVTLIAFTPRMENGVDPSSCRAGLDE